MGKVKAYFMQMEEDAKTMKEIEFLNKYGDTYHYIWRNEQVWIGSKKEKDEPDQDHDKWENGG